MEPNWAEIDDFFANALLNANVPGLTADAVARTNRPFSVGDKRFWAEVRAVPTERVSATDKTFRQSGVAVYTLATRPGGGTSEISARAADVASIFSPHSGRRGVFPCRFNARLVVRRVETAPGYVVDGFFKINVRITFDFYFGG